MFRLNNRFVQVGLKRVNKCNFSNYIVAGSESVLEDLKESTGKKIFYFTASWYDTFF